MKVLHNRILVRFHEDIETPLGLVIPERYAVHVQQNEDDNETRKGVTTDRRLINPQKVTILSGKHEGRDAFVYYGAYEIAKWVDDERAIIDEALIYFFIGGTIEMAENTYLGYEVFVEPEKTPAGIILSTTLEEKDKISIKISHIPENSIANVGDLVTTIDGNQYWLIYNGQRYIKLRESEIAAVNGNPVNENLLVEYIYGKDDEERMEKNQEIYNHIDFCRKHGWHIEGMEFKPVPEPKTIKAKVLKGDMEGEEIIVNRNFGVKVGGNKWIISKESVTLMTLTTP